MALRLRPVIGLSRCLMAFAFVAAGTLRVLAGEPVVNVDTDENLGAAHVRASIDIAAPPLTVWGVLTDCARAPHIIPNLESCQIVKHDPAGHWDIREHIIHWAALMPKMRTGALAVSNRCSTCRIPAFAGMSGLLASALRRGIFVPA